MTKPMENGENSQIEPDVPNPFVHRIHLTTLDKIQVVFMSIFVAPIRLVCVVLWLILGWFLAWLSMYGRTEEEKKQPLSGWRNMLRPYSVFCCRMVFWVGGFFWVSERGTRVTSAEAPVLATAPHSTYFDALFVTFVDLSTVVAKRSTEAIPFFGTLTNFTQPVYVSREDPNSRVNTIREIQERAQTHGKWPQIVIFPEGTCTNRKCLISFKPGAFIPGVPVQPVCLRYSNRMNCTTWTWDGPGAFTILWLTLCNFYTSLEIEYLPPYYPSEEEKKDARLFGNNVRREMAKALGVPVTDHTFEDCRLMAYSAKLHLPHASNLLQFSKLAKKLGITEASIKENMERLCRIAQNNTEPVTKEEFMQHLALSPSKEADEVFELFDRDGSGGIDFREYVLSLHLLARPPNCADTTTLCFKLFDKGNKGYVEEAELQAILHDAFGMTEVDVAELFKQIDQDNSGKITLAEFREETEEQHDYQHLFMDYQKAAELRDEELNNSLLTTMTRSKSE